jgi:uncharacterized protein YxjI
MMAATTSYTKGHDAPGYTQAQAQMQCENAEPPTYTPSLVPFALFPAFVAQKPETLVIKNRSTWTGKSHSVSTIDGRPVFNVKGGDTLSLSYQRHVHDANGTPIFIIKRESRFLQATIYYALLPSETGRRLFECEFDPWAEGHTCHGHFTSAINGQHQTFILSANPSHTKAKITNQATAQTVAVIKKESFQPMPEYHVSVRPGADKALVTALCIVMHDRLESPR